MLRLPQGRVEAGGNSVKSLKLLSLPPAPQNSVDLQEYPYTCGGMDILVRAATPLHLKTPFSAARRPLSSLNSCYPVSSAV